MGSGGGLVGSSNHGDENPEETDEVDDDIDEEEEEETFDNCKPPILAKKNREKFAIKKSYSIEVSLRNVGNPTLQH